jgi:hypothetical protein
MNLADSLSLHIVHFDHFYSNNYALQELQNTLVHLQTGKLTGYENNPIHMNPEIIKKKHIICLIYFGSSKLKLQYKYHSNIQWVGLYWTNVSPSAQVHSFFLLF